MPIDIIHSSVLSRDFRNVRFRQREKERERERERRKEGRRDRERKIEPRTISEIIKYMH